MWIDLVFVGLFFGITLCMLYAYELFTFFKR